MLFFFTKLPFNKFRKGLIVVVFQEFYDESMTDFPKFNQNERAKNLNNTTEILYPGELEKVPVCPSLLKST